MNKETVNYGKYKCCDITFTTDIETIKNGLLSLNQNDTFDVSETVDGFKIIYDGNYNCVPKIEVDITVKFDKTVYDDVSYYKFGMNSIYSNEEYSLHSMEQFIDFFIDAYIRDIGNSINSEY